MSIWRLKQEIWAETEIEIRDGFCTEAGSLPMGILVTRAFYDFNNNWAYFDYEGRRWRSKMVGLEGLANFFERVHPLTLLAEAAA